MPLPTCIRSQQYVRLAAYADGATLKVIWARSICVNPSAKIETGKDLDGSLVRTRLWTSVNLPF